MPKFYKKTFLSGLLALAGLSAAAAPAVTTEPLEGTLSEFPDKMVIIYTEYTQLVVAGANNKAVTVYKPDNTYEEFNARVEMDGVTMTNRVWFSWGDKKPTAPGEYTISVNSGKLQNAADGFKPLTCGNPILHYTLAGEALKDADVEITPAPGNLSAMPQSIEVAFKDEASVAPFTGAMAIISGPARYYGEFSMNANGGNTISIKPEGDFDTNGTYTVTIPCDRLKGADGEPLKYNNVAFSYNLKLAPKDAKVTISPSPGTVNVFPKEITVTFEDFSIVAPTVGKNPIVQVKGPGDFEQSYFADNVPAASGLPGNSIVIEIEEENPVIADGTYDFTIPVSSLTVSPDKSIRDVKFSFKLDSEAGLDYTVVPDPGTVDKLPGEVTVRFSSDFTFSAADIDIVTVDGPNGYEASFKAYAKSSNELAFAWSPLPKDAGAYRVTIDRAGLVFTVPQPEVEYVFTYVLQPSQTVDYDCVIGPAPGEISSFPSQLTVTFNDFNSVFPRPGMNPAATVTCPDGSVLNCEVANNDYLNTVRINISRQLTETGIYKVCLNLNALCDEDQAPLKGELRFEYILGAKSIAVSPAPGVVASLDEVAFTVRNAKEITVTDAAIVVFSITGENGETYGCTGSASGNVVTVKSASPVTAEGIYTVKVAENALTIDGETYPLPITAVYTISASGVELISSDSIRPDVYSIDGTLLYRAASPEQVGSLGKGIYIIGGKKVIVRR